MTREEAQREGEAFEGAAADRRARELSRISAALKREVARGEHAGVELRDLLSSTARERVHTLATLGVGVVLLDECHHLASLWGYVVRAVLGELPAGTHVIGLTATPPVSLPSDEAELYEALLGPVDFTVPTPAVVRDGHLAPYQELAWITEPLSAERDWLAEHDTRFRELVTALHDDAESEISFPAWVIARLRDRRRSAGDDAEMPWPAFQKRHPALARAGVRFLASGGLELPSGAPRGEAYRQPPDLDDWLVLLEDYALRCLAPQGSSAASARYDAIAAALRELGFQLTRRGIRRGTSEVDRLLTGSQAKALGLVEVLAAEADARGEAFRGLVLCDAELAAQRPDDALTGVLDPAAGTARHALLAIAADDRTAPLRPLLVSGRGLRCVPADADVLLEALRAAAEDRFALPEWEAEPDGLLVTLRSHGAEWMPRAWVELATRLLIEGTTSALVGTRALLGEGWNCPPLNVLVDMTIATTGVSVQQMRGRSLRLDPGDPEKVASNWDVVCVAPDLVRGSADYERPVRARRGRRGGGGTVARAPGARPVRAAAGRALPRAQPRADRARDGPGGGPRALADRLALPRRRAADAARAPRARRGSGAGGAGGGARAAPLPAGADRGGARRRGGVRRARRGDGSRGPADRARARARGARVGDRPARFGAAEDAARAAARRGRARRGRGLRAARRAARRDRRVAADRAARRRLPALRARGGDAGGGQALRGRAR
jgi:hypothetical protein